jgi:hypothetical protein
MKDYNQINRKDIEALVSELKNNRINLNQQIIKAQEEGIDYLVSLYRGEYFSTGQAITKLNKLLEIPFDDVVLGVQKGIFDYKVVVHQLNLEEMIHPGGKLTVESFAKILVATWRNENLSTTSFIEFKNLQQEILDGEKEHWSLAIAYNVSNNLSEKIVHSWEENNSTILV